MVIKKIKNYLLNQSGSYRYYKENYKKLSKINQINQEKIKTQDDQIKSQEIIINEVNAKIKSQEKIIDEISSEKDLLNKIISEQLKTNEAIELLHKRMFLIKLDYQKNNNDLLMYLTNESKK